MTSNDDYVLEVLKEEGLVTPEQIADVQRKMPPHGSVVDALISFKTLSYDEILSVLSSRFGMEMISLVNLHIPPEAIAAVPVDVARKYKIMPVSKHDNVLTVALGDPLEVDTLDSLRYVLKSEIEGVVALPAEITAALNRFYATDASMETMIDQLTEGTVAMVSAGRSDLREEADVSESDDAKGLG